MPAQLVFVYAKKGIKKQTLRISAVEGLLKVV
jgi:hypothetical protein